MQVDACLIWSRSMGDIFKALADPTRRAILDAQTLFELCARLATKHALGSTRQAITQHLDVLEAAGLVETERQGRYKIHTINRLPLRDLTERWLEPKGD